MRWVGNTDDIQHERDVLEKLEPSENVKQFVITGYGGTVFPGWFGNSSFSNMVALTLSGCKNRICLPPLGQLSSLEELQIKILCDGSIRFFLVLIQLHRKLSKKCQVSLKCLLTLRNYSKVTLTRA